MNRLDGRFSFQFNHPSDVYLICCIRLMCLWKMQCCCVHGKKLEWEIFQSNELNGIDDMRARLSGKRRQVVFEHNFVEHLGASERAIGTEDEKTFEHSISKPRQVIFEIDAMAYIVNTDAGSWTKRKQELGLFFPFILFGHEFRFCRTYHLHSVSNVTHNILCPIKVWKTIHNTGTRSFVSCKINSHIFSFLLCIAYLSLCLHTPRFARVLMLIPVCTFDRSYSIFAPSLSHIVDCLSDTVNCCSSCILPPPLLISPW